MPHVSFKPLEKISHWPMLLPIADQKGRPRFPIEGTAWIAGSLNHAHILLKSRLVSKSHAMIVNDLGESYVRDLGSTNGVYLNNQPVREARISDGDILNIGRFQFICYSGFPTDDDEPPQEIFDAELLVEGSGKEAKIRLRSVLIGRRDKCEMKLDDPEVSQVHAVIYRCDGRRFLRDLSSKNGTFLNHQRIRDAEIRPGDMIHVGGTILRYERTEESLRGSWIPDIAAEQAEPLRLADLDEGPLEPMTDSALELALKATEEMEVTPEPAPAPRRKKRKQIILRSKTQAKPPEREHDGAFETVAEALANVEIGDIPTSILDTLEPVVWDEGPTARNVDLPQSPRQPEAVPPEFQEESIPMDRIPIAVGKSDDEVADLLEDGFFRGAGL